MVTIFIDCYICSNKATVNKFEVQLCSIFLFLNFLIVSIEEKVELIKSIACKWSHLVTILLYSWSQKKFCMNMLSKDGIGNSFLRRKCGDNDAVRPVRKHLVTLFPVQQQTQLLSKRASILKSVKCAFPRSRVQNTLFSSSKTSD